MSQQGPLDNPDDRNYRRLLTVQEAAEYLGVADGTVYRLARRREITHYRIGIAGGTIRFDLHDLDEFLRQQQI